MIYCLANYGKYTEIVLTNVRFRNKYVLLITQIIINKSVMHRVLFSKICYTYEQH